MNDINGTNDNDIDIDDIEPTAGEIRAQVMTFLNTLDKHEYQELEGRIDSNCSRCHYEKHACFDHTYWVTRKFYILPYATFGDYDNSSALERSNARVFKENYPFVTSHGLHYGEYTGIDETDIDNITLEQLESLTDDCNSLADYPVLDEQDMSEVEMELQNEAWDSWGKSDFRRALVKQFGDVYEDFIDEIPDEDLTTLFYESAETANVYWEIESGGNAHIDIERIVKSIDAEDLELPDYCSECEKLASDTVLLHGANDDGARKCETCAGYPLPDYTNQLVLNLESAS